MLRVHEVLILAKRAAEYHQLVDGASLPSIRIATATGVESIPPPASGYEVVFGDPSLIAAALPSLTAVRWVQCTWAGVEPLLNPSLRRDYVLTNARGVFGTLMSEYVFGYMLAHERLVFDKYESQKQQRWDTAPPGTLAGRQVGLIGVGTIGAAIARTAKHFGMRVKGFTRSSADCPDVDAYFHGAASKRTFAEGLDYLISVAPNTSETRQFVDADLLGALPAHAVFINPGRGSVVDEHALVDALTSGRLARAVLDVFQTEPLPADHIFWRTPNVVITSHTAALSFPKDIAPLFIENYRRFAAGEALRHRVNFEAGY
jgi:phosphoglycerate dehydrogenase-like enzyme